jgi:hypothetical protein
MTTTTSSPLAAGAQPAGPGAGQREPALARLLAADGHSLPPAGDGPDEDTWTEHVRHWITLFGAGPGTTVWEAGCGAGSFLYPFYRRGCTVGGTDLAGGLIAEARAAMPAGVFAVASPAGAPVIPPADLLVSSAWLTCFDTPDQAGAVLRQMASRARRAVLVTGIPDLAARDAETEHRAALTAAPGPGSRLPRPRRYYTREWFTAALAAAGLPRVAAASQFLPGYGVTPFRFSAWGWCE